MYINSIERKANTFTEEDEYLNSIPAISNWTSFSSPSLSPFWWGKRQREIHSAGSHCRGLWLQSGGRLP